MLFRSILELGSPLAAHRGWGQRSGPGLSLEPGEQSLRGDGAGVQGPLASLWTHSPKLIPLETLHTSQPTFCPFTGSPLSQALLKGKQTDRQVTSRQHPSLLRQDTQRWGAVVLFKSSTEFPPAPGRTKAGQPRALGGPASWSLLSYPWLPPPKQKQVPARLQPSPQRGAARRGELNPGHLRINLLL